MRVLLLWLSPGCVGTGLLQRWAAQGLTDAAPNRTPAANFRGCVAIWKVRAAWVQSGLLLSDLSMTLIHSVETCVGSLFSVSVKALTLPCNVAPASAAPGPPRATSVFYHTDGPMQTSETSRHVNDANRHQFQPTHYRHGVMNTDLGKRLAVWSCEALLIARHKHDPIHTLYTH